MAEVAERKFLGDTTKLSVLRDGKPLEVDVKFSAAWPFNMQASRYDEQPPYVLFAGLLFQPLSRNLANAYGFQNPRIDYYFDYFISKELYTERPEVVILTAVLPDPLNTYLTEFREQIVDVINDKKVLSLKDVAEAFAGKPDYYVIKFVGAGRPLVLERAAVEAARERIKARYNVTEEQNLPAS
jgi:hypothetical protein